MNNFKKHIFKKTTDGTVIPPPTTLFSGTISNALNTNVDGCTQVATNIVYFKTSNTLFLSNGDRVYNTNDETSPFVGENSKYYKIIISEPSWAGSANSWIVVISPLGVILSITDTCLV